MTTIEPPVIDQSSNVDRKIKRRTIGALSFAQLGDFGEGQIINSMFPAVRDALGLNVAALGTITAVRRVVQTISMPIWGAISDRYSRKSILMWVTGIWGIWTLLVGFSQSFNQLLLLLAISSIGLAAIEAPLSSLISDLFPKEERGSAFGIIRSIAYFATVPTIIYFSILANRFPDNGWRIAFYTFGLLSVISGIVIWLFVEEPIRGQSEDALAEMSKSQLAREATKNQFSLEKIHVLFQHPTYIVNMVDRFFSGFPAIILAAFMTTWVVDDLGLPQEQAILFTLPILAGLILGGIVGGLMADRQLKKSNVRHNLIYGHVALVVLTISWLLLYSVAWKSILPILVLLFVLGFMLEFRWTGVIKVAVSRVVLPEVRGLAFSLVQAMNSLGRVVCALLVGRFADQIGLTATLLRLGGLACVPLTVIYFLYYLSYARDAETMQNTLATRAVSSRQ
ncbi:MAG: MFS transporter [Ardenticatenaceae bacterium]